MNDLPTAQEELKDKSLVVCSICQEPSTYSLVVLGSGYERIKAYCRMHRPRGEELERTIRQVSKRIFASITAHIYDEDP